MRKSNRFAMGAVVGIVVAAAGCKERPPVSPTPPPELEARVAEQAKAAGPSTPVGPINKGLTHDTDESIEWQQMLEMGKCYAFSAAAGSSVEQMKLYLFNGEGQRVMSKEGGTQLLATFCVTGQVTVTSWGFGASVGMATPGLYKIEIKTTEGYGHVHLGVFVTGQGAGAPTSAPPPGAPATAPAAPPAAPPASAKQPSI